MWVIKADYIVTDRAAASITVVYQIYIFCVHIYCTCMCVSGCKYLPTSLFCTSAAPHRHTKLESPFASFFHFLSFLYYVFTGCLTQPNHGPALVTESILVLALLFILRVQLVFICRPCSIYLLKTELCVCFSMMSGLTLFLTNDPIQRNIKQFGFGLVSLH